MVGVGLGGVTAWHNCDESRRDGGQAADQANGVGQADADVRQTTRAHGRLQRAANYLVGHAGTSAPSLAAAQPGPQLDYHNYLPRGPAMGSTRVRGFLEGVTAEPARVAWLVAGTRACSSMPTGDETAGPPYELWPQPCGANATVFFRRPVRRCRRGSTGHGEGNLAMDRGHDRQAGLLRGPSRTSPRFWASSMNRAAKRGTGMPVLVADRRLAGDAVPPPWRTANVAGPTDHVGKEPG